MRVLLRHFAVEPFCRARLSGRTHRFSPGHDELLGTTNQNCRVELFPITRVRGRRRAGKNNHPAPLLLHPRPCADKSRADDGALAQGFSPAAVPSREAQKNQEELRSDGAGSGTNTQACRTPRISKESPPRRIRIDLTSDQASQEPGQLRLYSVTQHYDQTIAIATGTAPPSSNSISRSTGPIVTSSVS